MHEFKKKNRIKGKTIEAKVTKNSEKIKGKESKIKIERREPNSRDKKSIVLWFQYFLTFHVDDKPNCSLLSH